MSQPNKPFIVNIFPADVTGCNAWRNYFPMLTVETANRDDILFNINRRFIVDQSYFNGANINLFQRQVSTPQAEYFNKFIIPISRSRGCWTVYNIDDCIHKDDIPKYNTGWDSYQSDELMSNIKTMLNSSDFVLVTTDELKQYFNDKFDVPLENVVVIPNYIPKWWIGDSLSRDEILKTYRKNRNKLRIGIISSASHFDVTGKQVDDDSTEISKYIRSTCKQYRWVIFGSIIPSIIDLIQKGDVEFHQGVDILHYPAKIKSLNLQAIIAPLLDNTFNRCKSNIKLLEGWALGIPVIGQNLPTYSKYTNRVFGTNEELHKVIDETIGNEYRFEKEIDKGFKEINNWWLENNIDKWTNLYKLRSKPIIFDFDRYIEGQQNKKTDLVIEK